MAEGILFRRMEETDIDGIVETFLPWHKYRPQYEAYWDEQVRGERVVLIALDGAKVVGYGTLVWKPDYAPFLEADVPEIRDLNVITAYQKRGIGSALIHAAERIAAEAGKSVIGIAVEQSNDYAAANRLYPDLGFRPDGNGIREADNLLFLTKSLCARKE